MTKPRACDCCSRRKVRCDRNYPCENCVKAGLLCSYATKPKKRGPKGRTKVIQALKMLQQGNINLTTSANTVPHHAGMEVRNNMPYLGFPLNGQPAWEMNASPVGYEYAEIGGERDTQMSNSTGDHRMHNSHDYHHETIERPRTGTPTSEDSHVTSLSYSQTPYSRSHSFGATYHPDPLTGLPPHLPNPIFRPDTLLLSKSFALTCSNIYFERLYPVMPLFHRNSFIKEYIDTFHSDPKVYAVVAGLCALTVVQLCAVPEEEPSRSTSQTNSDMESDSYDRSSTSPSRRAKSPEWQSAAASSPSDPNLVALQNYAQIFASISSSYSTQPKPPTSSSTISEDQRSKSSSQSACASSTDRCALSLLGHALISECLRARRYFDYISLSNCETQDRDVEISRTITDNIITSFFLFCCYGNLGKDSHAWYYLREACGFAMGCRMNDEHSYRFTGRRLRKKRSQIDTNEEENDSIRPVDIDADVEKMKKEKVRMEHLKRKLFWLLFVSERGYAIQRHHPLSLKGGEVELPKVGELWSLSEDTDFEEDVIREEGNHVEDSSNSNNDQFEDEKVILTNFVTLANLWKNFDDTFLEVWNKLDGRGKRIGNKLKKASSSNFTTIEAEGNDEDSDDEEEEDGIGFSSSWVEHLHRALESVLEEAGMGAGEKSHNGRQDNHQGGNDFAKKSSKVFPPFLPGYTQQAELYFRNLPSTTSPLEVPSSRLRAQSFDDLSAVYKTQDSTSSERLRPTRASSMNAINRPSSISFRAACVESAIPIQKADILLSTQWLHLIIWQLSVARTTQLGKVKKTPARKKDLMLPVKIAKQVLEITAKVGTETLEVHGLGMQEKLHDIGCALAAVIAVSSPPASPATSLALTTSSLCNTKRSAHFPELTALSSFQATPKDFLNEILCVLSNLRGGKSRYFEALLRKVDGVLDLSCPVIARSWITETKVPLALPDIDNKGEHREKNGHEVREGQQPETRSHSALALQTAEGMDLDVHPENSSYVPSASQPEISHPYPLLHPPQQTAFNFHFGSIDFDMESDSSLSPVEHPSPFSPQQNIPSEPTSAAGVYMQEVNFSLYPYSTSTQWPFNPADAQTGFVHEFFPQHQTDDQPHNPNHNDTGSPHTQAPSQFSSNAYNSNSNYFPPSSFPPTHDSSRFNMNRISNNDNYSSWSVGSAAVDMPVVKAEKHSQKDVKTPHTIFIHATSPPVVSGPAVLPNNIPVSAADCPGSHDSSIYATCGSSASAHSERNHSFFPKMSMLL